MGRRRKATLWAGETGIRIENGKRLPGYYVRYSDYDGNGRRRNRSKNFIKRADAVAWARQRNALQDLGAIGGIFPIKLKDAGDEFLDSCEGLAGRTIGSYTTALAYFRAVVKDREVGEITARDIDRFIERQLHKSGDNKVGPETIKKHLRSLSRFFAWAIGKNYAIENPVKRATIKIRGGEPRNRPMLTEAQIVKLMAALDTEDRRIAVWLAMTTGLDRNVLVYLRANQVDIANACIRTIRPKTRKLMISPIHHSLLPWLSRRVDGSAPDSRVFAGLHRQGREKTDWWMVATKAAGLSGVWFRDLRALAAMRLQLAGAALGAAQRLLGHASPMTTAKHYSLPDPDIAARLNSLALPAFPGTPESKEVKPESSSHRTSKSG